jgi:hypothetical protein
MMKLHGPLLLICVDLVERHYSPSCIFATLPCADVDLRFGAWLD